MRRGKPRQEQPGSRRALRAGASGAILSKSSKGGGLSQCRKEAADDRLEYEEEKQRGKR